MHFEWVWYVLSVSVDVVRLISNSVASLASLALHLPHSPRYTKSGQVTHPLHTIDPLTSPHLLHSAHSALDLYLTHNEHCAHSTHCISASHSPSRPHRHCQHRPLPHLVTICTLHGKNPSAVFEAVMHHSQSAAFEAVMRHSQSAALEAVMRHIQSAALEAGSCHVSQPISSL